MSPAASSGPAGDPDWAASIGHLKALRQALAVAQRAALDSVSAPAANGADALAQQLADLAQLMAQGLPALQAAAQSGPPPAQAVQLLQQLGGELDALRGLNTRLSARAQRALEVLFPADQVQAYSRLGARSPLGKNVGNSAGKGCLKA